MALYINLQAVVHKINWSWCVHQLHKSNFGKSGSRLEVRQWGNLINIHACLMKLGKHESWIVKADYGCVILNTQIPDRYSTWNSTSNKGRFPRYFWKTTRCRVIHQSLTQMFTCYTVQPKWHKWGLNPQMRINLIIKDYF